MDINQQRLRRKLLLTALSVLAAISLSACGGNKDSTNNYNTNSYGNDGYLGLSNSNPHLPNRNGQFLNYDSDGKFAQQQLKKVDGIAKATMMFQGPNLYVTIKPKPGYDEAKVRSKAISTLRYNMPRYTVHVNSIR
ncbi:hypothetical protein Back11_45040 [Paenibacillus baekrokdamisoli]|uniref:Uncharacterized protein n=1 Tax=Paenibacillus baekrokdamisoli TaxID=1712516 RepID=A0A3G9JJH2_9BACL|nr:hypothetical protein [Paenibacillus baekrokdamisoli]MBB3072287.1 hypothetical protein [Paenibacillus baekrokdamisoli]BBH23159.1 hypothetical protein Back11_45040 [Paenibacillus baekrokdamisoli]